MPDLQNVVSEIVDEMRRRSERGEVASYIPELARVDPNGLRPRCGRCRRQVAAGGDSDIAFSIQSISKVFTLTLALGKVGDRLWRRVGREPSGSPFNSVVQLEFERGIPRNPFINAGAIAVTDVILSGHQAARGAGRDPALRAVRRRRFLDRDRRGRRGLGAAHRLSQRRAGELHEVVRRARQPRRLHARRLFSSLRHRHVLPAACDGRALSRPSRPQSRRRDLLSSTRSAHGGSTP